MATDEDVHAFWVQRLLAEFGGEGKHLEWEDFLKGVAQQSTEVKKSRRAKVLIDVDAVEDSKWEDALEGVMASAFKGKAAGEGVVACEDMRAGGRP